MPNPPQSFAKSFALPLLLAASLGACSAQTPPPEPAAPPPAMEPNCGAGMLDAYVGRKGSDDVVAAIREWRGEHPVRVLKPGSIMTMDYRPDRLNMELTEDGTIKRFYCS